MTYNKLTLDCTCKCGFTWKGRGKTVPVKCPACGSRNWNKNTRSFTCIIARAGSVDEKTGTRSFCIIDYIDSPATISEDVFYISKKDLDIYFTGRSPPGSGLTLVGSFEISEDLLLKINSMKLVYCHESTFLSYMSTVSCLYNIKSFYQKQAALKKYNEDQLFKEILEDQRKEEAIKAARKRIDIADAKRLKTLECEKIISDDSNSISMEERLRAIDFLGK